MIQTESHQAADQVCARLTELGQRLARLSSDESGPLAGFAETIDRAVELLRQGERRDDLAFSLVDIPGVILLALARDGVIAAINHEGAQFLGYTQRELVGKDWFATCLPPESSGEVRRVFDRLLSGHTASVQTYENAVLCRSDHTRLIQWHNNIWRDGRGQVLGTISSGRDVTDHRLAEDAAEDTEARLGAVVNTAVDAIITIDEHGTIESVNPATHDMFGYTAVELVGRNVTVLMPSPYSREHDGYLRRYLETGKRNIIGIGREVIARRKDGGVFPIDLAVSEFSVGGRRMFTGVIRDISDRKALERQVLDIATQEQQRIGRDLHDSLGQELTGIAFLTDVLHKSLAGQGHPRADDAAEVVSLVNQAISHTRSLVRGLCPVNLEADGLMTALEQLAHAVKDLHGIRCEFVCPERILIDDHNTATQLYYIANEAVTNALRHGKPKRIIIGLDAADGRATLVIQDNGAGLPVDDKLRAGRGLHIMSCRARMIGGTLDIHSQPGRGARVTCSFTLVQ